jgi:uncharacterized membrane protein (DUF2068 family)
MNPTPTEPAQAPEHPGAPAAVKAPFGLKLIAGAKIAKGAALACLSLGVFDMIHKDLTALALRFVQVARISPENKYVELGLEKLGLVEPATLVRLGMLSALYASIQLIEGLGLWFGAAWAEYMVVISTGLFVPEECLGLIHHPSWLRLALLVVNAAILVYVACVVWNRYRLRRTARKTQAAGPAAAAPG